MTMKLKKTTRLITNQSSMELAQLLMIGHMFDDYIVVSDKKYEKGKFSPNDYKTSIGLSLGGTKQ